MSSKHIWLLTFVAVFVFALGLAFIAGNAEGADGGGSVNVDKTWVRAGQAEHYSFTYDPEDDFTGTNPGIRLTIPEVDQVLYPDWDPGSPTFHGWTTPQKTTSTARGYVWVSDVYDVVWSGAVITLENAPGHTYSGRRINVTFSSNLPESDEIVVIHYGSDTQSAKPLAQRHIEDDVYFRVESDENGDGQFVVTDTNLENPNVDVLPSNPYKLVMTILPDQTYDPNPYTTPTTYHDTDVIADKTVGVPFNVEFRLVDIYGNLVNDPDVSTYAFGDHNIRIRGAGISECDFIPIITDNALASIDWYTGPPPDATTQQDIEMEFFGGQVRWLIGYSGFDPIYRWNHSMTLYKAETEIELYSKIQPLVGGGKYEYETPSFDVVGITAPITKVYRDPTILDGQDRWITNTTEIYLHSTGLNESGVGIAYIQYRIWYDGAWTDWINGTLGKNVTITMADLNLNVNVSSEDDCKHYIEYRVKDKFCNPAGDVHEQTFYVDTTPPDTSTIKVIGDPQYDDTSIIWVTTSTSFTFDITPDPDEGCEGGVGLNFTMYRIYLYGTTPGAWIKWDGDPIYMPEECHHVIEWYGVDLLGNTEDPANYQEHYVDITPPDTSTLKVIGDPQWQSPAGGIIWVTTGTSFNFDISSDPDEGCEGGVGLDAIWYRIYLKGSTPGSWIKWDGNPIYMPEDCYHVIEWYGVDLLGNAEDPVNYQEHYVDTTPPDTSEIKVIGDPQYDDGQIIWVTTGTSFTFDIDPDPDEGCEGGVGLDFIMYRIYLYGTTPGSWIKWDGNPIYMPEECHHVIEWDGVDLLGNTEDPANYQEHYVDITPPDTSEIKVIGDPQYDDTSIIWVTTSTSFTFDITPDPDEGCEGGVGLNFTMYRIYLYGTTPGAWIKWDGDPIYMPEECHHVIEWYGVDLLGNTEDPANYQEHYVDITPPDTSTLKVIGDPQWQSPAGGIIWVTTGTSFNFDISSDPDEGCEGGVGLDAIWYRIYLKGSTPGSWIKWDGNPIYMPEECHHVIEWYGVDLLGNTEDPVNYQEHYVDDTPPDTYDIKEIGEPQWQAPAGGPIWNSPATEFSFNTTIDPDDGCEGGVGLDYIMYRILRWDEGLQEWIVEVPWTLYTGVPFYITTECNHRLEWYGVDLLGNKEIVNEQFHNIDITPPRILKSYGSPEWVEGGERWITKDTPIYLEAYDDQGLCNVGSVYLYYRIWYDGTWGPWLEVYEASGGVSIDFTLAQLTQVTGYEGFDEDCLHHIEYYAKDNIGNLNMSDTGYWNQSFWVDNTPPAVTKEYGTPFYVDSYGNDYITNKTMIWINGTDEGTCAVGSYTIYVRIWYDGVWSDWWYRTPHSLDWDFTLENWWAWIGEPPHVVDDCMHHIEIVVEDNLGNWNGSLFEGEPAINQTFYVDNTPPETLKEFEGFTYGQDDEFLSVDTLIWLNATDPEPCASGVKEIHWETWWLNAAGEWELEDSGVHQGDSVNVSFIQACNHKLVWWAVDNVSNVEEKNVQYHKVDDAPPTVVKEFEGFGYMDYNWLSTETIIWLNATDNPEGCWVGVYYIAYRLSIWDAVTEGWIYGSWVYVYDGMTGDLDPTYGNISVMTHFEEMCHHMIEFMAQDYLGHVSEITRQTHNVDPLPPTVTKEFEGPTYPEGDEANFWVTQNTIVWLNATDEPEICAAGVQNIGWRVWTDGVWYPSEGYWEYDGNTEIIYNQTGVPFFNYTKAITFTENCTHFIEYWARDFVCHYTVLHNQTYYVDWTAPTTFKEYGLDQDYGTLWGWCDVTALCEACELEVRNAWVTSDQYIYLYAEDDGCEGGIGTATVWFRIWYNGSWTQWYHGPEGQNYASFNMYGMDQYLFVTEKGDWVFNESLHIIEYYSVDCVGNVEQTHSQTFYVDNEDPIPEITNPVGITEEVEYDGFYYRPGYVFDPVLGSGLNYTESTGDEICYYQWSFSVPGNSTWIMIEEGCGDGKQVKWDTGLWADILEPWICSDEPNPILVKLKIWDEHCRNETSTIKIYFCREENPKPCTQIITIGQGWNLISIAVELDSLGGTYTASILAAEINSQAGENIVKYIVRWNAGTGKFNEYVVDNAIGYDFPIEKGEGYYVYSLSPFEVDFTIVGDCAECEYINLEICWNLVGWDSMDWMWVGDFVDLVNGIAGADVVQAVVRHVADDQYEAWYPGDDDYMFRMTTNNAYWVFVAQPVSNIPLP